MLKLAASFFLEIYSIYISQLPNVYATPYSSYTRCYSKFSYQTYRNGLNKVPLNWGTLGPSKNSSRVSSIPFVGNRNFSMFRAQGAELQKFICVSKITGHRFLGWVENSKLRTRVHKQAFSSACEKYVLRKTKNWRQTVEVEQIYIWC